MLTDRRTYVHMAGHGPILSLFRRNNLINYSVKTSFMWWPVIVNFAHKKPFWHGFNGKSLGYIIIGNILWMKLAEWMISTGGAGRLFIFAQFSQFSMSFKELAKFFFDDPVLENAFSFFQEFQGLCFAIMPVPMWVLQSTTKLQINILPLKITINN